MENGRITENEKMRIQDLMKIVPRGRSTVLDVGARDGFISQLLTSHFSVVTALDLKKPEIVHPGIIPVQGDATALNFPDNHFDTVFCVEVLEHIPSALVEKACKEIARITKYDVVIGVPHKQDIRIGRTTCGHCHKQNPPWGHINTFDEKKLIQLFKPLQHILTSFVGGTRSRTNAISSYFNDIAGNPWGTYDQKEPCIFCGRKLSPPANRSLTAKICSRFASFLTETQLMFTSEKPVWMHMVFMKNTFI